MTEHRWATPSGMVQTRGQGAEYGCVRGDGRAADLGGPPTGRRGWRRPGVALDPLAVLLRARYSSRAELARESGPPYQALRTWTDGLWTADRLPPVRVLAALSEAVGPAEVQRAVREAMLARSDRTDGPPPLTWGQRVVLEALRGFDDELLVTAAPHVRALLAGFEPDGDGRPASDRAAVIRPSPGAAG